MDARSGLHHCAVVLMYGLALASAGCSSAGQIRLGGTLKGDAVVDSTGTQAFLARGGLRVSLREANFVYGSKVRHSYTGRLIIALTNEGKEPVHFGDKGVLLVTSFGLPGPEEPPTVTSDNSQTPDNVARDGITLQPGQSATLEFHRITFYPKFLFLRYVVHREPVEVVIGAGVRY